MSEIQTAAASQDISLDRAAFSTCDSLGMSEALAQGSLASGRTAPNPGVGCAVFDTAHTLVGRGFSRPPGGLHAEIVALREAGEAARGGTLYVTLEPCSHWGRTPPCVDAIIAAGVSKVVAAIEDPDDRVSGGGFSRLRQAGLEVVVGPCAAQARRQMEGYLKFKRTGLPFVLVKMAMTLDGKIATSTGDSRWVTSASARSYVHELRDRFDAVMVGSGTTHVDDPLLTVRPSELPPTYARTPRNPVRIVVDSRAQLSPSARLLQSPGRTMVLTTPRSNEAARQALEAAGAEVIILPDKNGRVDLPAAMLYLGQQDVHSVMVEGGPELAASAIVHRLVDRTLIFVAPKIVGDRAAPGPIGGVGPALMRDALLTGALQVQTFDSDIAIEADLLSG